MPSGSRVLFWGLPFPSPGVGSSSAHKRSEQIPQGGSPGCQAGTNFCVPAPPCITVEKNDKKTGCEVSAKHEQTLSLLTDTQHFLETLVQCVFAK